MVKIAVYRIGVQADTIFIYFRPSFIRNMIHQYRKLQVCNIGLSSCKTNKKAHDIHRKWIYREYWFHFATRP